MATDITDLTDKSHYVFQNNPTELISYLYKQVSVETCDGQTHIGWVQTIDPVTGNIVLVQFEGNTAQELNIIMGHAVKEINVLPYEASKEVHEQLDRLSQPSSDNLSPSELRQQRNKIKLWLLKHRIPFEEHKDELNIMDVLVLKPPYRPDNCLSANEIVLGKIQGLIKAMPNDIEHW